MKGPLNERGRGRFKLGDAVHWRGKRTSDKRFGHVVEVLKPGMYPTVTRPPKQFPVITWPELCRAHGYREHDSYVVEDASGKRWWPRVGNLKLVHGETS